MEHYKLEKVLQSHLGYNYLVHIAKLNDYDKIFDCDEFKIYLDSYLKEFPNDKFITDFCWDLTEI